jgi:hypothetical protein
VALNSFILVNKVPDATGYKFTLTDTANGTVVTANSASSGLQLAPLNLSTGTVYTVVVEATAGPTIGPAGPACYITTTSSPRFAGTLSTSPSSLPYPNPFTNELWLPNDWLNEPKESELILSDLTGRVVKSGILLVNPIVIDANLPDGLYTIELRQSDGSRKSALVQKAN